MINKIQTKMTHHYEIVIISAWKYLKNDYYAKICDRLNVLFSCVMYNIDHNITMYIPK